MKGGRYNLSVAMKLGMKAGAWILLCGTAFAQTDHPLGFISAVHGAGKIQPAGTRTTLTAQPGMFLFPGDTLSGPAGSVNFYYCPSTPGAPKPIDLISTFEVLYQEIKPARLQEPDIKPAAPLIRSRL